MGFPLTELGRRLASPDAGVREEASRALAERGEASVAALLEDALEDEDASVRAWACYGLARLAEPADAGWLRCALMDEDPRVRTWAAYGLARTGDQGATFQLVALLEEGPTEVRTHAAHALATLQPPGLLVPQLRRLLEEGDAVVRTWAAALLAGRGSAGALAVWRRALRHPETRVDAALVAPHLRTPLAARDLVSLAARLPADVLRLPAGGAGSLMELLNRPLLVLGVEALLEEVEDEPELRRELYLLLGRAPGVHAAVREALLGVLGTLAPGDVGRELAEVLSAFTPGEAQDVLAAFAPSLPDVVVAAFHAFSRRRREELLLALRACDGAHGGGRGSLRELLRPSPRLRRHGEAPG